MGKFDILFRLNLLAINWGSILLGKIRSLNPSTIKTLKKNGKLRKSNLKCAIIGLGPSLKNVNIDSLEDSDLICVNRYHVFSEEKGFKSVPSFYILLDNYFFQEGLIFTKSIIDKSPNTNFILNIRYQKLFQPRKNVFFVGINNRIIKTKDKLSLTKHLHFGNNVVHSAIEIAMALGYKFIDLYGVDFDSFCKRPDPHCYDENKVITQTIEHHHELYNYAFSYYVHKQLSLYAKQNGFSIINKSKYSILDTYEKR